MYTEEDTITNECQARRWTFTWNNYPDEVKDKLGNVTKDKWLEYIKKLKCSYFVVGKEVAPTTGTPHLQGYMEFKSGRRFSTLAKALPGVRLFKSKGNAKQNYEYCTKEGDFKEEGDVGEQGRRMDLESAMTDIKSGMKEMDFFETHPMVMFRYPKACDRFRSLCEKKSMQGFHKREVSILWGITGSGKTRSATELYPDAFIVSKSLTGLWWDGYDGEETVILDEFRDSSTSLSEFLRITDGYYVTVPIRGGCKTLCAKTIIITSNVDPQEWYTGCDKKSREAMFRRFDTILYFGSKDEIREDVTYLKERPRFDPMAGSENNDVV